MRDSVKYIPEDAHGLVKEDGLTEVIDACNIVKPLLVYMAIVTTCCI